MSKTEIPSRRSLSNQFCIGTHASLALSLRLVSSVERLSRISRSIPLKQWLYGLLSFFGAEIDSAFNIVGC